MPTSDGAGVKLRRSLGQRRRRALDPFLMLDEFSSDDADDYIAGFPSHPHRGFETVTYMLDGHMLHEDHLGNRGDLKSGGVQWMTAGRGIIHSEMPQQEAGRMRGFQLWINLPAREKMKPAGVSRHPGRRRFRSSRCAGGGARQGHRRHVDRGRAVDAGPDPGRHDRPACISTSQLAGGRALHAAGRGGLQRVRLRVRRQRRPSAPAAAARSLATHSAGVLSDGDAVEVTGGPEGGALPAARRPAAARAGRAVRPVRDEHARGDRAGDPRLSERRADARRGVIAPATTSAPLRRPPCAAKEISAATFSAADIPPAAPPAARTDRGVTRVFPGAAK